MDKTRQYWFPAKPYGSGYGWGLPIAWQGWLVFIAFFVVTLGGMLLLLPYGELVVAGFAAITGAIFILVCRWKGEPQHTGPE